MMKSVEAWLVELADRTPTPGGGGAAGLMAAISAALIGMVTAYTTGEKWQDREPRMRELNKEAAERRHLAHVRPYGRRRRPAPPRGASSTVLIPGGLRRKS